MQAFKTDTEQQSILTSEEEYNKLTSSPTDQDEEIKSYEYGNSQIYIRGSEKTGFIATVGKFKVIDTLPAEHNVIHQLNQNSADVTSRLIDAAFSMLYEMMQAESKKLHDRMLTLEKQTENLFS